MILQIIISIFVKAFIPPVFFQLIILYFPSFFGFLGLFCFIGHFKFDFAFDFKFDFNFEFDFEFEFEFEFDFEFELVFMFDFEFDFLLVCLDFFPSSSRTRVRPEFIPSSSRFY